MAQLRASLLSAWLSYHSKALAANTFHRFVSSSAISAVQGCVALGGWLAAGVGPKTRRSMGRKVSPNALWRTKPPYLSLPGSARYSRSKGRAVHGPEIA